MTIKESFDKFILSRRLADLSEKTISDYNQFVTPFIVQIGQERSFSSLTQEDIDRYIETVIRRTISKSTKATYIRHVKIYLNWCSKEFEVSYDASKIKVPKTPKKEVRIYSNDEVALIFENISAETEWLTLRNKCIVALMYDSGLRQSEVCSIKLNNFSSDHTKLSVLGKGSKERLVPLGRLTIAFLKQYLALRPHETEYAFVTKHGDILTCNSIKLMISRLDEDLPFSISSHKLRHNFATNYCIDQFETKGNVDIYSLMYLLGHENIETTKRYLHFAMEIIATKNHVSHLDNILIAHKA